MTAGQLWNRQYYDTLAFHFWEPQHIGRTVSPDSPIRTESDAILRLKRLEVVLNHQMELFFRLAPDRVVQQLSALGLACNWHDTFCLIGREYDRTYAVEGLTQPDLLLIGRETVLAIELKIRAKTSLEQLLKYASLLTLLPSRGAAGLILMGPRDFPSLWKDRYQNVQDVRTAIQTLPRNRLPVKLRHFLDRNGPSVDDMLARMAIGFVNFRQFHELLTRERHDTSEETYARLLDGMIDELQMRGLSAES